MFGYDTMFGAALKRYRTRQSGDPQALIAENFLRFLECDDRSFERSNPVGHFTGSGLVVDLVHRKVLLTHHAKTLCWVQLGGHCDGIRDPFFVAWQECYQEGGLRHIIPHDGAIFDLDVHMIPEHKGVPPHLHYDAVYLFFADSEEGFVVSDESLALAWADIGDFSSLTSEARMLRLESKLVEFMELNGAPPPDGYMATSVTA